MPFPTSNNDYSFVNTNVCKSYNMTISTSLAKLTGAAGIIDTGPVSAQRLGNEPCGEVHIYNGTGANLEVYDQGFVTADRAFVVPMSGSFVFRGVTSVNQLSAKLSNASAIGGKVYYRTQFYSYNPSR